MVLYRLEKIVRTGRLVTTSHRGAGDDFEHRIEDPLVKSDQNSNQETEEPRDHDFDANRPRRRACRTQSASSSAKVAAEAPGRAMVTR